MARDVSLGSGNASGVGTTVLNTAAAAAANTIIAILVGRFNSSSGTFSAFSGGGLTWTKVKDTVNGNIRIGIWLAPAVGGLPSGTAITCTHSNSATDSFIGGASYSGRDLNVLFGDVDGSVASTQAWSVPTLDAALGGSDIFGGTFIDGFVGTSTPTTGTEILDVNSAGQSESFTLVDNIGIGGPDVIAGNWSAAPGASWISGAVELPVASGGQAIYNNKRKMRKRAR